jgi:hypothetical protein
MAFLLDQQKNDVDVVAALIDGPPIVAMSFDRTD